MISKVDPCVSNSQYDCNYNDKSDKLGKSYSLAFRCIFSEAQVKIYQEAEGSNEQGMATWIAVLCGALSESFNLLIYEIRSHLMVTHLERVYSSYSKAYVEDVVE